MGSIKNGPFFWGPDDGNVCLIQAGLIMKVLYQHTHQGGTHRTRAVLDPQVQDVALSGAGGRVGEDWFRLSLHGVLLGYGGKEWQKKSQVFRPGTDAKHDMIWSQARVRCLAPYH